MIDRPTYFVSATTGPRGWTSEESLTLEEALSFAQSFLETDSAVLIIDGLGRPRNRRPFRQASPPWP